MIEKYEIQNLLRLRLIKYFLAFWAHPWKGFNNSTSELKGEETRRKWRRRVEEKRGGGSHFYRRALFHRFISASHWMIEHTLWVEQL